MMLSSDQVDAIFGDVIYSYSRDAAIDDGVLIDVSEVAKEAGFRVPVAVTEAVWEDCIQWSNSDTEERKIPQDEAGRLWDVLWMARYGMNGHEEENSVLYSLHRVSRSGTCRKAQPVRLKAVIGPGDHGEPVLTIMLPTED
jgi:hypothetical protein